MASHKRGKKIDHLYVDRDLLAGMMVSQQQQQLLDSQFDRSEVIAIRPVKGFLRIRVKKPEAMEWRCRERLRRP